MDQKEPGAKVESFGLDKLQGFPQTSQDDLWGKAGAPQQVSGVPTDMETVYETGFSRKCQIKRVQLAPVDT